MHMFLNWEATDGGGEEWDGVEHPHMNCGCGLWVPRTTHNAMGGSMERGIPTMSKKEKHKK